MNQDGKMVYWTIVQHGKWSIPMAATTKGLCYTGPANSDYEELARWITKKMPDHEVEENEGLLQPYAVELEAYLNGKTENFSLPLDLQGTAFQQAVWTELLKIPYGQTVSYSMIAERIDKPQSVRAVGTAIGANPILITVPCHRVLAKNGKLAGFRGGLEMKKQLLKLENCKFVE